MDPIDLSDLPAVLALNNAYAADLSWLEEARLDVLIKQAFLARRIGNLDAFMIAFDQGADYDSPNFLWFKAKYLRFVYVDRIAVSPVARGRGLARELYEGLFAVARQAGHTMICCEVNAVPPNPGSDAFHARLGFRKVGQGVIGDNAKTVSYLVRDF